MICAVDYKKAFDTIRWDTIYYAMEVFGFGELVCLAIKIHSKTLKPAYLTLVSHPASSIPCEGLGRDAVAHQVYSSMQSNFWQSWFATQQLSVELQWLVRK